MPSSDDNDLRLVFDVGSRSMKAGFAGEHFPRVIMPTVVGRFRDLGFHEGMPEVYCGDEAIRKRGVSHLYWPVKDGLITDWDKMEILWHHVFFKDLHTPPETCKILHTVHPLVPKKDREKMAEVLFETFEVSGLNLVKKPVLVLYASGRTTGVVSQNGANSSYICPIFEGFPIQHTAGSSIFTGDALTQRFNRMLSALGYSFTTDLEKEIIEKVKAEVCYVAYDYSAECAKYDASSECLLHYNLPDGQHILIGEEKFKCPEVLFQPGLEGATCPNISDELVAVVEKCDADIRSKLYENIVASGGSSMLSGFVPRLQIEVTRRANAVNNRSIHVACDDLPSKDNVAWIGGSMIASINCLQDLWMTRQEYYDIGPDRVNYKFF